MSSVATGNKLQELAANLPSAINSIQNHDGDNSNTLCSFEACGGSLVVANGCGCTGDTSYALLYDGIEIAWDDDAADDYFSGLPGVSSECATFTLQQGCFSYPCSGTTTISGASTGEIGVPTAAPSISSQPFSYPTYHPFSYPSPAPVVVYDDDYVYPKNDTQVQGFVQFNYFDGNNCNGTFTYATGVSTDTCIPHGDGVGSYKMEFDDATCHNLRSLQYSDRACQIFSGEYPFPPDTACHTGNPGTFTNSGQMVCVVGAMQIPIDSTLMEYYNIADSTCTGNTLNFDAIINNYCLDVYSAPESDDGGHYYGGYYGGNPYFYGYFYGGGYGYADGDVAHKGGSTAKQTAGAGGKAIAVNNKM
eukprot:gene31777-39257_t